VIFRRFLLAAALLLPACASMEVTPRSVREAVAPAEERDLAIARWTEGVALANDFLVSIHRETLPPGRFELGDDGMTFSSAGCVWPITVRSTAWGDLCLLTGFIAQERSWGFVVGKENPGADRVIDNSFLRNPDGAIASAPDIASLLLHETTHVVLRQGTVGFWKGFAYYLEVIFLFRYEDHSAERQPYATTREFAEFLQASARR
jgi:hypothetical protein